MKALKIQSPGHAAVVETNIPRLRTPSDLLIKTVAVALNPSDWKHIDFVDKPATVGCDYSGVVEEIGSAVTLPFKKGDRVWGCVHGSNVLDLDSGCFGEYVVSKADLVFRIPENMGFEEAATLGVGIVTVGQGLYQAMGLPWPDSPLKEKVPILIYGGSSAMGAFGIQFAKLSGFEVITTCSQRNFEYVKSLGADVVFDYKSPSCGADIRNYTNDKLYYAWDTIGEGNAPQICGDALASSAPKGQKLYYGTIVFVPQSPRPDVEMLFTIGYSAQGESFELMGMKFAGKPEDYEFMKKWIAEAEKLLFEGKLRAHKPDVRPGGLDGILTGLKDMKNGKISGVKVVYRVGDP
ncbi:putative zinc-binding oxidoreductase ToxD [Lindgomyces ingoldianus]|uniref:Zinc-binding oxidoreductase ToxD n=1 Tax=Lindgomyces ingoldianus TaxID=673940 RepID=A0ACB6RF35_9PLEO|nr:putative zinc-binding oxidoreductase ToxD [Lindgomyces ingoldianus]KAF2477660.1 putative zinc-binding oxidoreductase ToxD [Lindgomyces ingoldianus]